MDKKIIIAIILILVVAVAGVSYVLLNNQPQYKNITMNGITMEVPDSNVNVTQQTDIFSFYNNTEDKIQIFVLDTTEFGFSDLSEAMTFAALRESYQVGATQQTSDGFTYNYSESTKVYSYVGNYTHKNLLIVTGTKEDMIHILETVKVDEEVSVNLTNETNVTNTTQPKKTTKKTKTVEKEEREDEKVIDGWDPKKHEVSREDIGDGYERVDYDDGYFRVVDKKGNIESYGY